LETTSIHALPAGDATLAMGSPFGGLAVSLLPQAASANAAAVVMMNVLMRIGNPSVWDVGLF
jgi:hypothetical protein